MSAPSEANYDDIVTASCTAIASSEDISIQWKIHKENVGSTHEVLTKDNDMYQVTSNVSFVLNKVDDLDQVNVICFWNESAMENQMQKRIKVTGKLLYCYINEFC